MELSTLDGIAGADRNKEITGDEESALVDELVKSVLSVGARLAPNNGASVVRYSDTVTGNVLAIRLHVALLEIGREAIHILIIGQYGLSLCVVAVDVHHTEQAQDHWHLMRGKKILLTQLKAYAQLEHTRGQLKHISASDLICWVSLSLFTIQTI